MSQTIYGGDRLSDNSILVRCTCAAGCIVAFDRWDEDDGPEYTGEFYTGFHPRSLRDRLKAAWTCLRGREEVVSSVVLGEEAATALGAFLTSAAPPSSQLRSEED